jgi:Domain of unknown function (DUF4405)
MKRTWILFTLDVLIALAALSLVTTGLLIYFVLPPGEGLGASRATLFSLTRHDFGDVHFWIAMTLIGLILVHVALHWQWVCTMISRLRADAHGSPRSATRNFAGLVFVLLVAGLVTGLLYWASLNVQPADGPSDGHGRHTGWRQLSD